MNNCRFRKGLIIHPGAIGDCLLALPLASFMKQVLGLDQVDWIGRTEYVEFYPGRTDIDRIRSMESIPFHRLFQETGAFEVEDKDPLIQHFSGYEQVISFLGAENSNFEQNFLYTIHCSQSAQLVMLPLDKKDHTEHISTYYLEQLAAENEISLNDWQRPTRLIEPHPTDFQAGEEIIKELGLNPNQSIVIIHPGSGAKQKCWPLENFILLAEQIRQAGHETIFLLGPAEKERLDEKKMQVLDKYPVLSEFSLTQILQILTCTDGYVGNDSGISHLAAAMAKPTLAVFGPTNPKKFAPLGPKVKILLIEPADFEKSSEKYIMEARKLLLEIL